MGRQTESESLSELPIWSADEPSTEPPSQPAMALFSDKDESAVAGLLALGTSTTEPIGPPLRLSEFTISPPTRERSLAQVMTPVNFPDYSVTFSPGPLTQPVAVSSELSPTETLELFRHYRYEVAPWVRLHRFQRKGLKTNMRSSICVTWGKYSESKACSWQWSHLRSEITFWRSLRHLKIYYVHSLHTRE